MVRQPTNGRWWVRGASTVLASALVLPLAMSGAHAQGEEPPEEDSEFSALVFSKTAGWRHGSIETGVAAIEQLGEENNFSVDHTEDGGDFTEENLANYDVVVWLSTTGDVLDDDQQAAFEQYIQNGGGYAGIHAASDTEYDWPWYGELVGAYFSGHPQNQDATVVVEDHEHPSTAHLPEEWERYDEWYSFRENPRGDVHVLASLDEDTYDPGNHAMGEDHPIAWCHDYDGGRAWYTAGGHTDESFAEPAFLQHILGGLRTAAGVTDADCTVPEPPVCEPVEVEDGYRALFDGTQDSLDAWRMAGPGSFELQEDCTALTVGGMGLLWYPEEFGDYSLKLDWKMAGDDNSGVFVGFPDPGDDPWIAVNQGYEIQIDATDEEDRTTGAIYTFQGADQEARDAALNPPGEWNSYEIVLEGDNIKVFLNDVLINDFDSDHPDRDLSSGYIGLQNHGGDDDVYFRNVRIAEPEPVHVPVEQVSIGMFSLIPWVNDVGLRPVLTRLAEIGFENVEPFGGNLGPYTAEQFRAMVDTLGLRVPSSHFNVGEGDFDETLAYVETLGQEYVGSGGFASPGIGSYEDTLATAATMNRLGERSVAALADEETGVTGKFFGHNHATEFTTVYEHEGEEMSAWEILVEETNPEYVTFQLDVAWAAHAGVDVPALIEEHGDRIELLHIKDATNLGGDSPSFTNLGEGDVDLQGILAAAQEHAPVAYYVLEYDVSPQGEEFARTGFEYLTGQEAGEFEPIHVPTENVSIGMFSLIPWVGTDGLPSVLARLAEIGFENVEPFGSNFSGYTAEEFRAMVDLIGLNVLSSHYNVDEDTFAETLEYVETLGQEYVGSGGFADPGISSYGRVLETAQTMNRLGEASVEAGIGKFFGHNHATEFTTVYNHGGEEMSAWEILVEETDPEYVTFQLDVAWAAHGGVDVPALIEEYGDRIELLHVKDATNLGGNRPSFTNLGEGDVDLQGILAAAREHADIALYVLEYDVAPEGEDFAITGFEYLTGQPAGEEGSRLVEVTPAAVTFTDEYGTDADTFTVPSSTGVVYLVDGEVVAAGTHPGEGTVTVTAQAAEGFALADGSAAEWTHTFSTAGAPAPDRRTAEFHLSNTWQGSTDVFFMYGRWADEVLIGDWNGDGRDTIAVRKGNEFHVSNSQRGGTPDSVFTYGRAGDVILVGDWDGDGKDTFAVRRGAEYHVKNTLRGGPADVAFTYGRADDQVLVGDWNGSDVDTLAIRRGATYHVKNSVIGGDADVVFTYGRAGDVTLAGDWDGDGSDTFAIQRGRTYHVTNSLRGGDADTVVTFGRLGDEVYVGDWDGNGTDTLGIRRPVGGVATSPAPGGPALEKEVQALSKA